MDQECVQGIVLRAVDYQEHMRIITLFSRQAGVMSFLVKNRQRYLGLTTPLTEIEVIFKRGRVKNPLFLDGSVLNENLYLRTKYSWLEVAGDLSRSILHSQMAGKSAPLLYELLSAYLKQIPVFESLPLLRLSFKMKLLIHEGVLLLSSRCVLCGEASALFLEQGQSVCKKHRTSTSCAFNEQQWGWLLAIEGAKRFATLQELKLPLDWIESTEKMIWKGSF